MLKNNFFNDFNKKIMFNIGALGDVISALILLYTAFQDIFKHVIISYSLLCFAIIKLIGKILQVPYNLDKPNLVIKNITIISIYTLVAATYIYNIYINHNNLAPTTKTKN